MSGTSLDGVDAVLVRWSPGSEAQPDVVAHEHQPFEPSLRAELMALNQAGPDELRRAALAANGVALAYAQVLGQLLARALGGFDCGPGNVLLDLWAERHLGQPMDDGGRWAAGGRVHAPLLQALLGEPFLALAPPKSTGRDLFHAAWLQPRLAQTAISPQDVQATLAEFSARATADALLRMLPAAQQLTACGGGAFNADLMCRLARLLPRVSVRSSADAGLPPDQVEAVDFAWLARAFARRKPGNRVEVTGASGLRVLGALHPGAAPRLSRRVG